MTKTKAGLVAEVAAATGFTKRDTAAIVNAFIRALVNSLNENHRIEIRGFGVFKNKARKGRNARNPRTGEAVAVPARLVPTFKPSKELKNKVAKNL